MNIEDMLEINDCPLCDGGALLEEECGCGYYGMCLVWGCYDRFSLGRRAAGSSEKNGYALEHRQGNIK
mgnify:CR=1 FL=1